MQNDRYSHGLWELTAPAAPKTDVLADRLSVDVAIVGGGYIGLSAALHLAERGVKVALLEAVEIGFGGAGRNVGLVNPAQWVIPSEFLNALGPKYGERLLKLLGDAPLDVFALIERLGIDCETVHTGTLHCGVGKEGLTELEQRFGEWSARGAPVTLLDAKETADKVGSSAYACALLDARAGTIQPLAYARGLATAAIKAGAQIFTGSAVTALAPSGAGWELATARGRLSAARVIVATDVYSTGPFAAFAKEQVRLPYFNFATAPLPAEVAKIILPGRQGAWDTKEVLSSYRYDRAGRLVFGSVGALRAGGLGVHQAWARRAMAKLFPALKDIPFESAWWGTIGMTSDNLPKLHRLAPGVIGFCGLNGRGISPGTVLGRILALHLVGEIAEADLPLSFTEPEVASFGWAKSFGYELGAQLAHGVDARF